MRNIWVREAVWINLMKILIVSSPSPCRNWSHKKIMTIGHATWHPCKHFRRSPSRPQSHGCCRGSGSMPRSFHLRLTKMKRLGLRISILVTLKNAVLVEHDASGIAGLVLFFCWNRHHERVRGTVLVVKRSKPQCRCH